MLTLTHSLCSGLGHMIPQEGLCLRPMAGIHSNLNTPDNYNCVVRGKILSFIKEGYFQKKTEEQITDEVWLEFGAKLMKRPEIAVFLENHMNRYQKAPDDPMCRLYLLHVIKNIRYRTFDWTIDSLPLSEVECIEEEGYLRVSMGYSYFDITWDLEASAGLLLNMDNGTDGIAYGELIAYSARYFNSAQGRFFILRTLSNILKREVEPEELGGVLKCRFLSLAKTSFIIFVNVDVHAEIVPFVFVVARDALSKSLLTYNEYENLRYLYRLRPIKYAISVLEEAAIIDTDRYGYPFAIYGYSSELDNVTEVNYANATYTELPEFMRGCFFFNEHGNKFCFFDQSLTSTVLANQIRVLTYYYDETTSTMVDVFSIPAGDCPMTIENFKEEPIGDIPGFRNITGLTSIRGRLIAARSLKEDVPPHIFLHSLFRLDYAIARAGDFDKMPRIHYDTIMRKKVLLNDEVITQQFVKGILYGMELGLCDLHSNEEALKRLHGWLKNYLQAIDKGEIDEYKWASGEILEPYLEDLAHRIEDMRTEMEMALPYAGEPSSVIAVAIETAA